MPVYQLDERLVFPPAEEALDDGLLAVGGDLSPERLVLAYASGIFPWHEDRYGPWWYSPDPRMVLLAPQLRVSHSLRKTLRKGVYRVTLDAAFPVVLEGCAETRRPGQDGTWISSGFRRAYRGLHKLGLAHSVETWRGDELVGGLYGVSLGTAFFGESMFARAPDASKVAFVRLVQQLARWGFALIDCQVYSEHLVRFGAEEWPRTRYLAVLREAVKQPTRRGRWQFDSEGVEAAAPVSPGE